MQINAHLAYHYWPCVVLTLGQRLLVAVYRYIGASSMEEVDHVHSQGVSDEQEMAQLHLTPALHSLHRRPVEPGRERERLLGHVQVKSPHADAVADGPAGIEDPLRLVGWHPANVLATMIISQQQICGIL